MDNSATYLLLNSTLTESNYDSSMGLNRLPEGNLDSLIDKSGIKRVLILQWRDLDDAEAGGSEVHSHNIAEIWASKGLQVTFRTSAVKNSIKVTSRNGYTSVRSGGRYGVFLTAPLDILAHRLSEFDALVEVWNGMPFMTPLLTKGPNMVFLHHQHGPLWNVALPRPLAGFGRFFERKIFPNFYRSTPIVTLSESSRSELSSVLSLKKQNIHVVEPGVSSSFHSSTNKSEHPLVVVAGRLSPYKQIDRVINVVTRVRSTVPNVRLEIIGEGPEEGRLRRFIASLPDNSWVSLRGRVSEDELVDTYQRAWVATSASLSEGWGMTMTEAARCGTASVASNIPGHVDAVSEGVSGYLFNNDGEFERHLVSLLSSRDNAITLGESAHQWSSRFTWEKAATESFRVLASTKKTNV
mgnify:CR=1 FL=1